jgi:diketogulonate reductase-like aldo/keto reductase
MYGTAWKRQHTEQLTAAAIRRGYAGIDTANQRGHYVEAAVGKALRATAGEESLRGPIFLQTKFTPLQGQLDDPPYERGADISSQVKQSIHSSLEHLGVSRIDSYLLHGPCRPDRLDRADWKAWRAMEDAARAGWIGLLGVSNFTARQLAALLRRASIRPAFLQNRCVASDGWDSEVRRLCDEHGIVYQPYSLVLANRKLLLDRNVRAMARRYGKSSVQLLYGFAVQIGMMPITGTSNPAHMSENLEIADFTLDDRDVRFLLHWP